MIYTMIPTTTSKIIMVFRIVRTNSLFKNNLTMNNLSNNTHNKILNNNKIYIQTNNPNMVIKYQVIK